MAGTLKRLAGPAYVASSAADIITSPASTLYDEVRHIHLVNKDSSTRTVTFFIGATGASAGGTEIFKDLSLAVAGVYDYYCLTRLLGGTDYLTGIASAASAVVVTVEGYRYAV